MTIKEMLEKLPEKIEIRDGLPNDGVYNLTIEKIGGGWTIYYGGRQFAYAFVHKNSLEEALEEVKNVLVKEGWIKEEK